MNEYQERALEIVERLSDDKKINIRERGTLRRAILLKSDSAESRKWILIEENPYTNVYKCPFCGHVIHVSEGFMKELVNCESCGADMTEAKE